MSCHMNYLKWKCRKYIYQLQYFQMSKNSGTSNYSRGWVNISSIKVKWIKATPPLISWSISFPPWNVRQANKINKNGYCKTLKTFPSSFPSSFHFAKYKNYFPNKIVPLCVLHTNDNFVLHRMSEQGKGR